MLESKECEALQQDATQGLLTPVSYENAVLLDYDRLKPLALVVLAGIRLDILELSLLVVFCTSLPGSKL